MKATHNIKRISLETICILYVVLFVYAAVSKLLDFENFQVQLGQSPLLSAFAGWVSWGVPIIELVIALLLLVPRFRLVGLYAAFSIMVMFTAYIVIILNFSSFVPCSCGGILEKMGWGEHLVFNSVFVLLALTGILLMTFSNMVDNKQKTKSLSIIVSTVFICSIGLVALLYVLSEDIIHHRNNFVRRFPHHPVVLRHEYDLQQPSYYIAGVDKGSIYLGNSVAPLVITVIDTALDKKQSFRITLPKNSFSFRSVRVTVKPPYFYLTDGTVPVVFRGKISDWKASIWMDGNAYFTHALPIDSERMVIRALSSTTGENVLGMLLKKGKIEVKLKDNLLVKQLDGVFDTDGMLLYNYQLNKAIYTYYYRNEFLVADSLLNLNYVGHTIDTTSRAKIKVTYIKKHKLSKLSSPPHVVNKNTATYGKYLFVNATLMGKYEPEEMWDVASIIDVYDIESRTYQFSFYVSDKDHKKMSDFKVSNGILIGIMGNYLFTYQLKKQFDFTDKDKQ